MNICTNCGVELEDNMQICPLCGLDPKKEIIKEKGTGIYPSEIILLHRIEIRKHIWEITGIIAFSAIVVCTIVDMFIVKGLKWSFIVDSAVTAAWVILSFILKFPRRPLIILTAIFISVSGMLFIFDLLGKGSEWFFKVGLPITLSASLLSGLTVGISKMVKRRGINILGVAFLSVAIFCLVIEFVTDKFRFGTLDINWSVITAASIFPISLIFFFIHYRMKKGNRLDSFLHV